MGEQASETSWAAPLDAVASGRATATGAESARPEGSRAVAAGESAERPLRPGPLQALFSLVVWPNWTAGLLLVATFWMPHFTGCNNQPIRPVEMWSEVDDGETLLTSAMLSFPYLWGGVFAISLIAVALIRPRRPERALFGAAASVYLLITSTFFVGVTVSLSRALAAGSADSETGWIWACAPAVIAPGIWAAAAVRKRDWYSAWARLSTCCACLAVPTIMLAGVFARESRYGFNLAMLACGVLVPACWGLRWRGRRAFVDRMAASERLHFRLVHLVLWITFIAVICGYYRYLASVQ